MRYVPQAAGGDRNVLPALAPMTTLLLTQPSAGITLRRLGLGQRLAARLRAVELDRALAQGASPDLSSALSLRARMLIGHGARRRLARELEGILRRSQRPRHPFDPTVPLCRAQVRQATGQFEHLADVLRSLTPVEAAGVAQLQLLVRDGAGPIYNPARAHELTEALESATAALRVSDGQEP